MADRGPPSPGPGIDRLGSLDGLRGLAALWVLVGHAMILTGFSLPVLGNPELGVDLFIMLSGFLMVYQFNARRRFEDWSRPRVWHGFWIRRFFRISPLYFVLLALALALGPMIYADRLLIDSFLSRPPQLAERYTDASLTNILAHVTYVFGFLPDYAFRTPLPDWSIGLEMQFYLAFPFLVLLCQRLGWMPGAVVIALVAAAIYGASRAMGISFPMPAFLPLKMHIFLAGMLIAAAPPGRPWPYLVLILCLVAIPIGGRQGLAHIAVREAIALAFFALLHLRGRAIIDLLAKILASRPFFWMGELSYGVYLIHLLVLHPVAAWAISRFGTEIAPALRFCLVLTVTAAASYALALAGFLSIERPGQALGRRLARRIAP